MATRVTGKSIKDLSVTDADIATPNKDGLLSVPCLRTLGAGPQQAASGDDIRLSLNDEWFKQSQLSPSTGLRFYVCGQPRVAGGFGSAAIALDTIFLMPFRVTTAFTLRAVGVANTNSPVGTLFNIGIYDSVGAQDLHPNNVVAQLGVSSLNVFPSPFQVTGLSLSFSQNQVYWVAVVFSGVSPTCRTITAAYADPLLGFSSAFTGTGGIGFVVPGFPAAVFPSPLPAATILSTNGAPMMLFGV